MAVPGRRHALAPFALRHAEGGAEGAGEGGGGVGEADPVLRAPGAGDAGLDRAEIQREGVREQRVGRVGVAPQPLRPGVGLDQRDARGRAGAGGEIVDRLPVDGEEAAGRAVFRGHVGDGRAVGEPQLVQARPVELDELADHAVGAQHLRHGEHQVRRRRAFAQAAREPEAHDLGQQHRKRLPEHRRLRLDAADAPAEDGQAAHHRRVAVGADQGVGIGERRAVRLGGPHHLGQVFQIDLMADAGAGRHHAEVLERLLAPAEEGVALAVAGHFQGHVLLERAGRPEAVDRHRVVDHEIDRGQRLDAVGIAAQPRHGRAHRRQIDQRRHAGEILHEDARRAVADLPPAAPRLRPAGKRPDVVEGDGAAVLEAQQVLEQDLEGEGQAGGVPEPGLRRRGQAEIGVGAPVHGQGPAGVQAVPSRCDQGPAPSSAPLLAARAADRVCRSSRPDRRGAQDLGLYA